MKSAVAQKRENAQPAIGDLISRITVTSKQSERITADRSGAPKSDIAGQPLACKACHRNK